MAITKKQKELDIIKWEKSIEMGKDACGTFDYCVNCDKTLENPCDKAFTKTAAAKKEVKKAPIAKKAPAAKPEVKAAVKTDMPAASAAAKPVAKKTNKK